MRVVPLRDRLGIPVTYLGIGVEIRYLPALVFFDMTSNVGSLVWYIEELGVWLNGRFLSRDGLLNYLLRPWGALRTRDFLIIRIGKDWHISCHA